MKETLKQFIMSQGISICENFQDQENLIARSAINFLLKYYQENMFVNNATGFFEEVRILSFGS
jgi:hypothetical protein